MSYFDLVNVDHEDSRGYHKDFRGIYGNFLARNTTTLET